MAILFYSAGFSQNVGIGTSTPLATLEVKGNFQLGCFTKNISFDTLSGKIRWYNSNLFVPGPQYLMHHSASAEGLYYGVSQLEYHNQFGTPVFFTNWNTGHGYFSGNLGIGINAPTAKLSISADQIELAGSAASNLIRTNAGTLGNMPGNEISLANFGFASSNNSSLGIKAYRWMAGTDWFSTSLLIGYDVDNTPRAGGGFLAISANGNIGISSTTPAFPLSFPPVLGDKISLWSNSTTSYGFGIQSGQLQIHTDISAADIVFGYGSSAVFTEKMRIKGNGKVGIGTTTPAFKLHVANGSINTDSVYRINTYTVLATPGIDNLFVGAEAGILNQGFSNTFCGYRTGYSNTSGSDNSFFGYGAGYFNTTGFANAFFGRTAGNANTTGGGNSFFGSDAGLNNTTGYTNSFFGQSSGVYNTIGSANSFFGQYSGVANTSGNKNSFFGQSAGYFNTTGNYNSFFGESAGYNNTSGNENAFFGRYAGLANTMGHFNSFFGVNAGLNNTDGTNNSFFGWSAGKSNTTGSFNAFFGLNAGSTNTMGSDNSFFGLSAGFANTTGANNAFFGRAAGLSNSAGNENSFFGRYAGISNTIGTLNTAMGYNSDVNVGVLTNASAIGANAQVECSNCMVLGSVNQINGATSNVNVGIGTTEPLVRLHIQQGASGNASPFSPLVVEGGNNTYINLLSPNVNETGVLFGKAEDASSGGIVYNSNPNLNGFQFRVNGNTTKMALYFDGNAWLQGFLTQGSDLRLKKDIHPLQNSLFKITQLTGYNYYWINETSDRGLQTGVIAQEVQKLFPDLVKEDNAGMLSVNYSGLIPVLIESIKEQQQQLATFLQHDIELQQQIDELKLLIQELAAKN